MEKDQDYALSQGGGIYFDPIIYFQETPRFVLEKSVISESKASSGAALLIHKMLEQTIDIVIKDTEFRSN